MSGLLPFIIAGLTVGSAYSLAAVGLVLTFKTSGSFNFAHGALGTIAAYLFYVLWVEHGVPWPWAGLVSLVVVGGGLGVAFERFGRGLARVPMAWRVVATVGVLELVQALATIIFGPGQKTFPHFLPTSTFTIANVAITYEQLIITLVSVVSTALLYVYFRVTRMGVAMRAVIDDPDLLDAGGTNPRLVRRWAWIIGCSFATLSGLLLVASVDLDPLILTLLVVQAYGAAAVGRFSSIPLTWLGGIVIGIGGSVITKYASGGSILAGIGPSLPFIVLFVVLLVTPRSRMAVKDVAVTRQASDWRAPGRLQGGASAVIVAFLISVPFFAGYNTVQWTLMLANVLLFVSLGFLARAAGQLSLCQVGFAAIGAASFARLTGSAGIPWFLALLICGLIAVPIGAFLAIPAIRLGGLYLALATFGFGLVLQDMFYSSNLMFGSGQGLTVPRPHLSWLSVDSQTGFYYVALVITCVVVLAIVLLDRTRLGRLMRGASDSPLALAAQGSSVTVLLVLVFCISAFVAAISGAIQASALQYINGYTFDPTMSLLYVIAIMVAAGQLPWNAVIPAAGLTLLPVYISSGQVSNYLTILFGVSAAAIAFGGQPQFQRLRAAIDRWFRRPAKPVALPAPGERADVPVETATASSASVDKAAGSRDPVRVRARESTLIVQDLTVRFSGLVAVDGLSFEAPCGQITGLIGPNGAGKSTTLNVCSGLASPTTGTVRFGDDVITNKEVAARARMGLGRTFQQIELFESLSVWDNVWLGREGSMAGAGVMTQMLARPGERRLAEARAADAIERCGLQAVMYVRAGSLPTGQRRLVEIARCLAGPFDLLLLDEPSSGLDRDETRQLGALLRSEVRDKQIGIVLVEHDMSLVMSLCDMIYVIDFGKLIFQGTPQEVQDSVEVQRAYLGGEVDSPSVTDPTLESR